MDLGDQIGGGDYPTDQVSRIEGMASYEAPLIPYLYTFHTLLDGPISVSTL